jgi:hypothetical protein
VKAVTLSAALSCSHFPRLVRPQVASTSTKLLHRRPRRAALPSRPVCGANRQSIHGISNPGPTSTGPRPPVRANGLQRQHGFLADVLNQSALRTLANRSVSFSRRYIRKHSSHDEIQVDAFSRPAKSAIESPPRQATRPRNPSSACHRTIARTDTCVVLPQCFPSSNPLKSSESRCFPRWRDRSWFGGTGPQPTARKLAG